MSRVTTTQVTQQNGGTDESEMRQDTWLNLKQISHKVDPLAPSNGHVGEELDALSCASPGFLPEDVYQQTMPWWRYIVRKQLLKAVAWESQVLAAMQDRVRTPLLDSYFVYTSSLGTHTFFMAGLPLTFFFGFHEFGRGLVLVLGIGAYVSSFVKDLFCSPRPFAPPVTRLTIGTHHLEYGFPSTHSTNSISIALFVLTYVHRMELSATAHTLSLCALAFYAFSIVYGRLYAGMHGFVDCACGIFLGTTVWALHQLFEPALESWLANGGWEVPATLLSIGLVLVHKHPQPVDDCPCFEDAIAFVSVIVGILIGRWHSVRYGFAETFFTGTMPGVISGGWTERCVWWLFAFAKMTCGIFIIFAWRLLAKALLRLTLPPTFRLLSQAFTLPHRRFYTPATDYKSVPAEHGLRAIPSMIDLPSQLELEMDADATGVLGERGGAMHRRKSTRNATKETVAKTYQDELKNRGELGLGADEQVDVVKHYDADVLTKVIVYCGIAILALEVVPVMFEVLGWGVHPW